MQINLTSLRHQSCSGDRATSTSSPFLWNLVGKWKIYMDKIELNIISLLWGAFSKFLCATQLANTKNVNTYVNYPHRFMSSHETNIIAAQWWALSDLLWNFSLNWARNIRKLTAWKKYTVWVTQWCHVILEYERSMQILTSFKWKQQRQQQKQSDSVSYNSFFLKMHVYICFS